MGQKSWRSKKVQFSDRQLQISDSDMGVLNFDFGLKFSENGRLSGPDFVFCKKMFRHVKIYEGQLPSMPWHCHDTTGNWSSANNWFF